MLESMPLHEIGKLGAYYIAFDINSFVIVLMLNELCNVLMSLFTEKSERIFDAYSALIIKKATNCVAE